MNSDAALGPISPLQVDVPTSPGYCILRRSRRVAGLMLLKPHMPRELPLV